MGLSRLFVKRVRWRSCAILKTAVQDEGSDLMNGF